LIICEPSVCPEFAPELPSDKPAQAASLTSSERRETVGLFPVHLVALHGVVARRIGRDRDGGPALRLSRLQHQLRSLFADRNAAKDEADRTSG
jgi:hypothetical protein